MNNLFRKNKYLIFAVIFVVAFSLLPLLYSVYLAGPDWQGILLEYTNDGLYYYARMSDVGKGHVFIGNPFFLEHLKEYSPAFFGADWLASWPLWLGFSLEQTVVFNYLLWPLILLAALLTLFKTLGLSRSRAIGGAVVSYLSIHELMSRPVVMQVVFPVYVLFLVALLRYLKEPNDKKNYCLLICFYALTFYLYSYLWQIAVVTMFLLLLWWLVKKDWINFQTGFLINFASFVLVLPVLGYTYLQINSPYFFETMTRLGLVKTHLPTMLAVVTSFLVMLSLGLLFIFTRWFALENKKVPNFIEWFFMISGGALIITNLSNMVTGQEIEIANHISRFIGLWVILLVVFLLSFDNFQYSKFLNLSRIKQLSSLVVIGVFCWIAIPNVIDFLPSLVNRVTDLRADNVRNLQAVAKPLTWLETNAQPESVIWTDRWISYYVPSRTHHYVLFSPGGGLHLMPSAELVDRYLVANYFRDLTVDDLKNDFRSYAGVGNAIHQYKTNNRRVQLCLFFRFDYWGYNCGQMADSFSWRGEQYFLDLEKKYQTDIKPHINQKLVYYQVAYILIDKVEDKLKLPIANISNQTLLYQDQRFEIYGVNQVGQTRVTGS